MFRIATVSCYKCIYALDVEIVAITHYIWDNILSRLTFNFFLNYTTIFNFRSEMKRRTLSGSCGIGLFMISFICVFIAFATPSWIVSDYRITGAKLDRLGLWTHCFRSLADPNDDYNRRFFVGCRWVFDPFTTGYDEIRGFLIPRELNLKNQSLKIFY